MRVLILTLVASCVSPAAPQAPNTPASGPAEPPSSAAEPGPQGLTAGKGQGTPLGTRPTAAVVDGDPGADGLVTAIWAPLRTPAADDPVEVILHWQRSNQTWLRGDDPIAKRDVNWSASFETWSVQVHTDSVSRLVRMTPAGGGARPSSLYVQPTLSLTLKGRTAIASFDRRSVMTRVAEDVVEPELATPTSLLISGQLVFMDDMRVPFETAKITIERKRDFQSLEVLRARAQKEAERLLNTVPKSTLRSMKLSHYGIDQDLDDGTRVFSFMAAGRAWRNVVFQIKVSPAGAIIGHERRTVFTCVGKDTPILTPRGEVAVQDLRVGDRVSTFEPETGEVHRPRVLSIVEQPARATLRVGRAWFTPEHPVYSRGLFRAVGGVGAAPWLVGPGGPIRARVKAGDERPVYDIVVEPPHTFVAGGALVHNKSRAWSPSLGNVWRFAPVQGTGGYGNPGP